MIKTCKRCENEPKLEGLDVGPKCVAALEAEVAKIDEALHLSDEERLEKRAANLRQLLMAPALELAEVEAKLREIAKARQAEANRVAAELAAEADRVAAETDEAEAAEVRKAIARLEDEIALAKKVLESAPIELTEPEMDLVIDSEIDLEMKERLDKLQQELATERAKLESEESH